MQGRSWMRLSKDGPKRIKDLIKWGIKFDKKEDGAYDLTKEGGHSQRGYCTLKI